MSGPSPEEAGVNAVEYRARKQARLKLASLAVADRSARVALFHSWGALRVPDPAALFAASTLPVTGSQEPWVSWALGRTSPPSSLSESSETGFDQEEIATATAPPSPPSAEERQGAALYLLARLGEELLKREGASQGSSWGSGGVVPLDREETARKWWNTVLGGHLDLSTGRVFRALYGGTVRRAFAARCLSLHLPAEVARQHGETAVDLLDYLPFGPHLDVATRILESSGEAIATLALCLTETTLPLARQCQQGRSAWSATLDHPSLSRREEDRNDSSFLAQASFLHLALRLRDSVSDGVLPSSPLGLPGWGVVVQNRGKMRGRLRALLPLDPRLMAPSLLKLPHLYLRTEAAVARFAWDWAWREARAGFSFSAEHMAPPPCTPGKSPPPPSPMLPEGSVRTLLLLWIGRGCWSEVGRWMEGRGGRDLSAAFYRALALAPDSLADPASDEGRSRSYEALRRHLREALSDHLPLLREVGARVAALTPSRALKAELHRSLAPHWEEAALPLPQHHLPGFLNGFRDFLANTPSSSLQDGKTPLPVTDP